MSECPACEIRKDLLKEGGDHEGVMALQAIGRLSKRLEDLGQKYRGVVDKQGRFAVEVNGPANCIMLIETAEKLGQPVNLEAVKAEAQRTIRYLEALGQGKRPAWHEIKVNE